MEDVTTVMNANVIGLIAFCTAFIPGMKVSTPPPPHCTHSVHTLLTHSPYPCPSLMHPPPRPLTPCTILPAPCTLHAVRSPPLPRPPPLARQARGAGHMINMGSIAGHTPYQNGSVYNASKFAVNGYTNASRFDLMHTPLRVSHIAPGLVGNTEFSNVRLGDEAAAKVNHVSVLLRVPKTPLTPLFRLSSAPKGVRGRGGPHSRGCCGQRALRGQPPAARADQRGVSCVMLCRVSFVMFTPLSPSHTTLSHISRSPCTPPTREALATWCVPALTSAAPSRRTRTM